MYESFEYTPGAALAPYVERAVGYLYAEAPAGIHVGMPSCSLTLVIPLDEPLTISDPCGPRQAFDSVIAGLSLAPTLVHHDGYQHGIQLALRPAAARALFGCRPAELAHRSVEWTDVFGSAASSLRDRLHETAGWPARLRLVEDALTARLAEGRPVAPEVGEAWRLISTSGGRVRVRDLARRVGWSARHLEQRFAAEYGLTPKSAARVRRFERSRALVSGGRGRLSDVAAVCGYADQAHLARDWRDLAGLPPSRWRAEDVLAFPDELAEPAEPDEPDGADSERGQPIRGVSRHHDNTVRLESRTRPEEEP